MALIRSSLVTRHCATYSAFHAGSAIMQDFRMTLTNQMANGDIVEMARLQPDMLLVGAKLILADFDSSSQATFDVGILTGDYGIDDPTRTCGAELFPAAKGAPDSVTYMSHALGFRQDVLEFDRGVGLSLTSGFTAAAADTPPAAIGQVILILECIQKGVA